MIGTTIQGAYGVRTRYVEGFVVVERDNDKPETAEQIKVQKDIRLGREASA